MGTTDLWTKTRQATRRAIACRKLEPIATDRVIVEEHGIAFVVHVLEGLERKRLAGEAQRITGDNPFLPPDPDLVVCDVTDSHLCVLNRFNVIDHHLLIVTRQFTDQNELLDLGDFDALAACMANLDGLGFYNAGTVAGASQRHKHLQLVPLPFTEGPPVTPMDAVYGVDSADRSSKLRFPHALSVRPGVPISRDDGPALHDTYRRLLEQIGIDDDSRPYNLLLTRGWMLAVPRKAELCDGISVNALGFAGSLLVRDRNQLERVRDRGPLSILREVAGWVR